MDIDKIYSLRHSFTVIGLTGRLGAGCSTTADILSKTYSENGFTKPNENENKKINPRKYKICYDFASVNWKSFRIVKYKSAVLLHLLREDTVNLYREIDKSFSVDEEYSRIKKTIKSLLKKNKILIDDIRKLETLDETLKDEKQLEILSETFFSEDFEKFSSEFYGCMDNESIPKRIDFSNRMAKNLRQYGRACEPNSTANAIDNIYCVSETINRIIKSYKSTRKNGETVQIVIDSLRNSIELLFFKERYSAFYMISINSDERRENLESALQNKTDSLQADVKKILDIDMKEYDSDHIKNGDYYSPDLQNCIQKADIHLKNNNKDLNDEFTIPLKDQLLKFTSLMQQPGLITPSHYERCMQVAYNAKFNSGCISRQVGAAISDSDYVIKSIGWNDVPKGHVSCSLRNAEELLGGDPNDPKRKDEFEKTYSEFERTQDESSQYKDVFRKDFQKRYEGIDFARLKGRNCSFCFKENYNAFKGEKNQVHTRSLHAEENAMLQISKNGGEGLEGGVLFTTASPCELCSKKAYQLGIRDVFYIDPYPGIAKKHILKGGSIQPRLNLFYGAVGTAFHKLYEPFLAYKDEVAIRTGVRVEISLRSKMEILLKAVGIDDADRKRFLELVRERKIDEDAIKRIIKEEVEKHREK